MIPCQKSIPVFLLAIAFLTFATTAQAADNSVFRWAKYTQAEDNNSVSTESTAVDTKGNVYSTGKFAGTVNFHLQNGTDLKTSQEDEYSTWLTKVDKNGNYNWTKIFKGTGSVEVVSVSTDSADNIYIAGRFIKTADFDPEEGIDSKTSRDSGELYSVFLTRINANGSYGFTKTFDSDEYITLNSMVVDPANNIYLYGLFRGDTDFNPFNEVDLKTSPEASNEYIYVTKLNSGGSSYGWTKVVNATSFIPYQITADTNIYFTGYYYGTANFNPDGIDSKDTQGEYDAFIVKLKSDGTYSWSKTIGGTRSNVKPRSITTDPNGNIYIFGDYYGTVDFDPGTSEKIYSSVGLNDMFLLKLDSNASYLWTKFYNSDEHTPLIANQIKSDKYGNIYFSGYYRDWLDFDTSSATDKKPGRGIFLSKLNSDDSYAWTRVISEENVQSSVYPSDFDIDYLGNIYNLGYFYGKINFDPTGSENIAERKSYWPNMFLVKYTDPISEVSSKDISISTKKKDGDKKIAFNSKINLDYKSDYATFDHLEYKWDGDKNWAIFMKKFRVKEGENKLKIRAIDVNGNVISSTTKTLKAEESDHIYNLEANTNQTTKSIKLTWDSRSKKVARFDIFRIITNKAGKSEKTFVASQKNDSNDYEDKFTKNNKTDTVKYKVYAFDTKGKKLEANEVEVDISWWKKAVRYVAKPRVLGARTGSSQSAADFSGIQPY